MPEDAAFYPMQQMSVALEWAERGEHKAILEPEKYVISCRSNWQELAPYLPSAQLLLQCLLQGLANQALVCPA